MLNKGFTTTAVVLGVFILSWFGFGLHLTNRQVPAEDEPRFGAPATTTTRNFEPFTDSTYYIGTQSNAYLQGSFDELCLTADTCNTSWPSGGLYAYGHCAFCEIPS